MKVILFDQDQTLADHNNALLRDYKLIASPDEDLELLWADDAPTYVKQRIYLIRSQRDWWLNLEVIDLGMQIYRKAREIGFESHILTKGPWTTPHAWTEKVLWTRKHLDSDVKINISEDKSLVYGRVLVDDYPPYVTAWLKKRPRGTVIMPAYHYNKNCTHPNIIRCDGTNMGEVEEALIKAYNR
jgi:hypothetical protein